MEHIKTKKHVLKKAGGFLLLTAVILAGSTWERRTAGDRQAATVLCLVGNDLPGILL